MRAHLSALGSRLHGRIYVAVLASVVLVALMAGAAWHLSFATEPVVSGLGLAAEIAGELLPPAGSSREAQQAAVARWGRRARVSVSLYSPERELLASHGDPLPPPPPERTGSGTFHPGRGGPAAILRLADGRWMVVRRTRRGPLLGFLWLLVLGALSVALAAWPISRRITRRLERLKESVEALGAGDLAARVTVEGRDEVALLASSFNRAAGRIEELVGTQRRLLANASHELRTPLARLRVAAGLLDAELRLKQEIARDVDELDGLVEEILLASRLEAGAADEPRETVDLTALAAEECARAGATLAGGEVVTVEGSPRLLRRLLRNLLENARRHGGGGGVEVVVRRASAGGAELDVLDRGPGVPPELRERIFEPFFRLPGAGDGGAGLGLSIARQVARRHGGDVVCLPRDGGGTLFRASVR